MSKPLEETHPTLVRVWKEKYGTVLGTDNVVQSCTVDIADHDDLIKTVHFWQNEAGRLKKEYDELWVKWASHDENCVNIDEVACLKKELEEEKKYRIEDQEGYDTGWKEGLVEGERRAMERVKKAILRLDKQFANGAFPPTFRTLYRELGLGEEEKR